MDNSMIVDGNTLLVKVWLMQDSFVESQFIRGHLAGRFNLAASHRCLDIVLGIDHNTIGFHGKNIMSVNTSETFELNTQAFWPLPTTIPHDKTVSVPTCLQCFGNNLKCKPKKKINTEKNNTLENISKFIQIHFDIFYNCIILYVRSR